MIKVLSLVCVLYGSILMIGFQSLSSVLYGVFMLIVGAVSFMIYITDAKIPSKKAKEKKSHAFFKVVDTIASCTTYKHVQTCRAMVMNYEKMYQKEFPTIASKEAWDLMHLVHSKDRDLILDNAYL